MTYIKPTMKDIKLYTIDGQLKAEMDVFLTHEDDDVPSIQECRFAALQLKNKGEGHVVYDRLLNRIVNGVFYGSNDGLDDALDVAQYYNEDPSAPLDMVPNGDALGLKYPKTK